MLSRVCEGDEKMRDLKPCPRCKNPNTGDNLFVCGKYDKVTEKPVYIFWGCAECYMQGPHGRDEAEAAEFWNLLPRLSDQKEVYSPYQDGKFVP